MTILILYAAAFASLASTAWNAWQYHRHCRNLRIATLAHEAAEKLHREYVERLNNILESDCPRCVILSATLQAERQKAGAVRA